MAVKIAEKENANLFIVSLLALLHDVDDYKLSPKTNEHKNNAMNFLKTQSVENKQIEIICSIIN